MPLLRKDLTETFIQHRTLMKKGLKQLVAECASEREVRDEFGATYL